MAPTPTTDPDGADLIFGQGCSALLADPLQFCGATAHAKHSVAIVSGNLQGEIVVTVPYTEPWALELSPWTNYYDLPATQGALAGNYKEELADFAQDGDTIIRIDASGYLSFQSADSGCTGSGLQLEGLIWTVQSMSTTLS